MSEFTAEDFAQADLATKGRFGVARRTEPSATHQWHVYGIGQGWLSDEEMAADGWVPVVEAESRTTLDGLEAAWGAAEQVTECRKGDVLILKDWDGGFQVYAAMVDGGLMGSRILSRAPKPEPWADLADVLLSESVVFDSEDASIAARALHNAGVRVKGDE